MIIACIHCGKDIELDITNVLRQRIEAKIKQFKGTIPWEDFNKNDIIFILEDLLE